jgi:hypothetical protein
LPLPGSRSPEPEDASADLEQLLAQGFLVEGFLTQ